MEKHLLQLVLILASSSLIILNGICQEVDNTKEFDEINKTKLTDERDGNSYDYVTIGNQIWMSENLRYKPTPNNGNHWPYNNNEENAAIYGYLYDWMTAKRACPNGWHLPSDNEWKQLEIHLGMSQSEAYDVGYRGTNECAKLKETGTAHWQGPNTNANNESGFTALPGGGRSGNGFFNFIGTGSRWWSSTENSPASAWDRGLDYYYHGVYRGSYNKGIGLSVRCVKD